MKKFKMMSSAEAAPAAAATPTPAPAAGPSLFLDISDARPPALTDEAVAAAESALGVTLPQSLKDTLKVQNGGFLARCSHPAAPNSWSSNHVPVDFLPGIWSGGADVGELSELVALQRLKAKRGVPQQLVILCGDDHGCIALDYSRGGAHAEPAVVYWQKSGPVVAVAADFAAFKDGLCNMERLPDTPAPVPPPGSGGGDGDGGNGAEGEEGDYEADNGWGVAALLGPDLLDDDDEDDASFHGGAEDEEDEDFVDEEEGDADADAAPDADEPILPPGKKRDRAPMDPGDVQDLGQDDDSGQ